MINNFNNNLLFLFCIQPRLNFFLNSIVMRFQEIKHNFMAHNFPLSSVVVFICIISSVRPLCKIKQRNQFQTQNDWWMHTGMSIKNNKFNTKPREKYQLLFIDGKTIFFYLLFRFKFLLFLFILRWKWKSLFFLQFFCSSRKKK